MSKSSQQNRKRKKTNSPQKKPPERTISDRSFYLGFMFIGAFLIGLVWLATGGHWKEPLLAYCLLLCLMTVSYAYRACRGEHLPPWRQSLAKLILRWAGYGTKDGKPIDAAHDAPAAKKAVGFGAVACLVVLAGLTLVLFPKILSG
jgi:hypothetical protein